MFTKFHNRQRGFTLIELMIVVVIIGILAALAVPRFMRATTKSKQSEGKQILKQIYTMERTYRQENNTYFAGTASAAAPNGLVTIGVEVGVNALYVYVVAAGDSGSILDSFTATATANLDDDAAIDTWTIKETGVLTCSINDATT